MASPQEAGELHKKSWFAFAACQPGTERVAANVRRFGLRGKGCLFWLLVSVVSSVTLTVLVNLVLLLL